MRTATAWSRIFRSGRWLRSLNVSGWIGWLSLGALGLSACDRPPVRPSAAALPSQVAVAVDALASQCRAAGGRPLADRAVSRGDFNSDGREDFVVYAGWMDCENAVGVFGDREKGIAVFAGEGAVGSSEAFTHSVFDVKIEEKRGKNQLWVTVSGVDCGKVPAATFSQESFCDRAIVWDAAAGQFNIEPIGAGRSLHQ